ncbi:Biotin--protein ligase [Thelohanellus kitauei]|uniref:Biotin--protein ligase n=1 Tax=Thelohanellus kitauei TaxID=669202 RepID=A0A0C2JYM8_THEKT|nr:Biotin--protein ligase [Thelohanellus kitauei]
MSFSSNIIYFYEKTSIKILFDYLNENLCKRSYDLHSLTFDKHVARVPFENSACLIVLDMIEVENVLGMSDKIKEYLKNNHTRLWMNVGRGQIYKYSTNWGVCCGYALDQELSMEPLIKSSKEFPNRIVVSELTKPKESEISLKLIVDYLKLNIKNFDDPNDSIFRFSANFRISEKGFELIENKFDNCEYHPKSKLDFQKISSNLKTRSLGNRIIAFERISSTLDVAESLKSWANNGTDLVIIADQQLSGRGRGDNKWISNLGCLMMTIVHPLPSHLPPTLIQHVLALAAVESIIEIRKIPLFIKWPNDIYYKNELKIGGVLVKLCVCDDKKILISSNFEIDILICFKYLDLSVESILMRLA